MVDVMSDAMLVGDVIYAVYSVLDPMLVYQSTTLIHYTTQLPHTISQNCISIQCLILPFYKNSISQLVIL